MCRKYFCNAPHCQATMVEPEHQCTPNVSCSPTCDLVLPDTTNSIGTFAPIGTHQASSCDAARDAKTLAFVPVLTGLRLSFDWPRQTLCDRHHLCGVSAT